MSEDRRDYFRVESEVLVNYKVVKAADVTAVPAEQQFTIGSAQYQLASQLKAMDNELSMLNASFDQITGELADYIHIIHRKIDLIGRYLIADSHQLAEQRPISVNLSEQGMSFFAEEEITPGSHVVMSVTLFPSYESFFSYGKVVRCNVMNDNVFVIGLQFIGESSSNSRLLARHVLQVQQAKKRMGLEANAVQ